MLNNNFTEGFHPTSKCWIYQSSRTLTSAESAEAEIALINFAHEWTAHKLDLKSTGKVLLNRFFVLVVDESLNPASGCSIDTSVKFIREMENHFNISLLDRTVLLFEKNEKLFEVQLSQLNEKILSGEIQSNMVYFDNSISSLSEMKNNWKIQVSKSWIAERYKMNSSFVN